jgi:hypothetical protein
VRGNRGENYENEPWFAKNIQRKKKTYSVGEDMKNQLDNTCSLLSYLVRFTECEKILYRTEKLY